MSSIPSISSVPDFSKNSEVGQVQHIVDEHCKDYPTNIPISCNLLVMEQGKKPVLYQGGNILTNGPINWAIK